MEHRKNYGKAYIASTNKLYLGPYKTIENAQKAVEAKVAIEFKREGKVL
jgi:hypothetical protein